MVDASYTPSYIIWETSSTVNLYFNLLEISDSDEEDDKDGSIFSYFDISCDSYRYEDEYDSTEDEDDKTIINHQSVIKREGDKLIFPASSFEINLGGLIIKFMVTLCRCICLLKQWRKNHHLG